MFSTFYVCVLSPTVFNPGTLRQRIFAMDGEDTTLPVVFVGFDGSLPRLVRGTVNFLKLIFNI